MQRLLPFMACYLIATSLTARASSISLPSASYDVNIFSTSGGHTTHKDNPTCGPYTLNGAYGSVGCGGVPFARADVTPPAGENDSVQATLTYYMQVAGPDGVIPMIAHVLLTEYSSAINGSNFGQYYSVFGLASLEVTNGTDTDYKFELDCNGLSSCAPKTFNGNSPMSFVANQAYTVVLSAGFQVSSQLNDPNGEYGHAFADPYFYVDPNTGLDPSLYTVQLSDGFTNTNTSSSVPEPGTIGLTGSAIGVAVLARRKRGRG